MSVVYHEQDANLQDLAGRRVGVLGYGSMGRPIALNLRDSGVNVFAGVRSPEKQHLAQADRVVAAPIETIVQQCDIVLLMLPDEVMPRIYLEKVSPFLQRGSTLIFASGYNVAFGFIEAPPFVDVGLLAPRTSGVLVRERYLDGTGFYSFVSVAQDASRRAWKTVLALALAAGSLKAGAIEVSIEQEAELDLFIQQTLLPIVHNLFVTAAALLLRSGYPPEAALSELYISDEFTDYLNRAAQLGLLAGLQETSLTNQYGTLSRIERFNDLKLERLLEVTLRDIRSGNFAKEWRQEYSDGYPRLRKLLKAQQGLDLWDFEQQTLDMLKRF